MWTWHASHGINTEVILFKLVPKNAVYYESTFSHSSQRLKNNFCVNNKGVRLLDRGFLLLALALIVFGVIISTATFSMTVSCGCVEGMVCTCPDPYFVQKVVSLFPIAAGGSILLVLGWRLIVRPKEEAA
jgi:hypothetical protein